MLTVPVVPAFVVVVVVSAITGSFAVTVTVAPVVASTLAFMLSLNAGDVILVFKAVAAASSFTFTSYTMTNFFASRRLRLLTSTSVMEMIVTSVADKPRDFAMSPSSSVFLPSASAFVNPVNSNSCFTTFFGSTTGALVVEGAGAGALVVVTVGEGAAVVDAAVVDAAVVD